jgi:hypothetical protein
MKKWGGSCLVCVWERVSFKHFKNIETQTAKPWRKTKRVKIKERTTINNNNNDDIFGALPKKCWVLGQCGPALPCLALPRPAPPQPLLLLLLLCTSTFHLDKLGVHFTRTKQVANISLGQNKLCTFHTQTKFSFHWGGFRLASLQLVIFYCINPIIIIIEYYYP